MFPLINREIHSNDRYIIIASDGVLEFFTNQMVADMLGRFTDPLAACKAVATASYNMWLEYEERTDDITIIAIYLDDIINGSPRPKSQESMQTEVDEMEARPVRRDISNEKRNNLIALKDHDEASHEPVSEDEAIVPKTEAEKQVILSAMRTNFVFQHLNTTQRAAVVDVMKPIHVVEGEWIIRQGDAGDKLYVVDTGRYEVRVKTHDASSNSSDHVYGAYENRFLLSEEEFENIAGDVVHIYESAFDQHPAFGELSLM